MSDHTPGPWEALKDSDANCVATISGAWTVVSIGADPNKFDVESDARLIAAAPEMLKALEYLLTRLDDIVDERIAQEAIAKAKGSCN